MSAPSNHSTPPSHSGSGGRSATAPRATHAARPARATSERPPGGAPNRDEPPAGRGSGEWLSSLATLLVVVTAVPIAAFVVPNTVSYIAPLVLRDLGGTDTAEVLRMAGLALPALMLVVPIAAAAARRLPAWTVLLAGLLIVAAGELLAGVVHSAMTIGVARAAQGLGAGTALPATVVLVWAQRRRLHAALWAGMLVAGFILAMPLALGTVPRTMQQDWRPALQPMPWLLALAVSATLLAGCAWLSDRSSAARTKAEAGRDAVREDALPLMRRGERTQLLLPLVPACGFAFLAVATTYGWSPGAQLIVAALGGVGLLGVAAVGSRAPVTGSTLACAVVVLTVGMVTLPVASPLTGLVSTVTGISDVPLAPFAAGAVLAVAGALAMLGGGRKVALAGVLGGHAAAVVAVLLLLTAGPTGDRWALTASLMLLGLGLGAALAGSLRGASIGAALFAVAMCFPAVLTGHLAVGSLQLAKVNAALLAGSGSSGIISALTTAFRTWLVAGGTILVVMAAVAVLVGRRAGASSTAAHRAGDPPAGAVGGRIPPQPRAAQDAQAAGLAAPGSLASGSVATEHEVRAVDTGEPTVRWRTDGRGPAENPSE